MRGTLYNAFNPLYFDPRGRHYKNNTEADIIAVSSLSTSADAAALLGSLVTGVTRRKSAVNLNPVP